MNYWSLYCKSEENSMFLFRRHKKREAEIQSIRGELFKKADEAEKMAKRLNKLLQEEDLGVTGRIFYATGGDRRRKK